MMLRRVGDPGVRMLESLKIRAALTGVRPFRILVSEPHSGAYGHLALETLYAMEIGKRSGARVVVLVPSGASPNTAIYALRAPGTSTVVAPPWAVGLCRRALAREQRRREEAVPRLKREEVLRKRLRRRAGYVRKIPFLSRRRKKALEAWLVQELAPIKKKAPHRSPPRRPAYFLREEVAGFVPARLASGPARRAARLLAELGVDERAELVTLHVREEGYKRGREIHEGKPGHPRHDSARNAHIADCLPVVDELVAAGYVVVRLGDPTMEPLQRDGVVDLTRVVPESRDLLNVHCLLRSSFLLGCESGPSYVAFLTGTPTVVVNATDPISSYPLRAHDLFILKHVRDRETGRLLAPEEMLGRTYLENVRNVGRWEYLDNTTEEIAAVVAEMRAGLAAGAAAETPSQRVYREQVSAAVAGLRREIAYIRKWGGDGRFLGDGRIGAAFIEEHAATSLSAGG